MKVIRAVLKFYFDKYYKTKDGSNKTNDKNRQILIITCIIYKMSQH